MTLAQKVAKAKTFIKAQAKAHKNPIVFSSFGKDSMVMLDLVKKCGLKFPIIFHKEPHEPKKYAFANAVILENGYSVYDYAPLYTKVAKRGDAIEIIGFYQLGTTVNYMPTGIRVPEEGKDFLCGLADLYNKPKGSFNFPWDLALVGHKSTDSDPILGHVPLAASTHKSPACEFIFPLRYFSDADVWEYTEREGLPINSKRYNRDAGWKEFADITYNPDYFHACTRCLDRDEPSEVLCPKTGQTVPNVSATLRYSEPFTPSYVEKRA